MVSQRGPLSYAPQLFEKGTVLGNHYRFGDGPYAIFGGGTWRYAWKPRRQSSDLLSRAVRRGNRGPVPARQGDRRAVSAGPPSRAIKREHESVYEATAPGLLAFGRYRWLDRIVKVVVAVLTLSTVSATILVFTKIKWGAMPLLPPSDALSDAAQLSFIVALVGWMPSAFDIAVWQSLWTLARRKETGHAPTVKESMLDFNIGYFGTAALALCFITLGAGVMYGSGETFQSGAAGFAAQIIELYTHNLGAWSRPLIGVSAFTVMFSTTLTVVDGFPRTISCLLARFREAEQADAPEEKDRVAYWASLGVLGLGSTLVIVFMLKSLTALVDLATILSFMTAPALAVLNHRAIHGAEVPKELQPPRWLTLLSWAGIAFSGLLAAYFVWVRFLRPG